MLFFGLEILLYKNAVKLGYYLHLTMRNPRLGGGRGSSIHQPRPVSFSSLPQRHIQTKLGDTAVLLPRHRPRGKGEHLHGSKKDPTPSSFRHSEFRKSQERENSLPLASSRIEVSRSFLLFSPQPLSCVVSVSLNSRHLDMMLVPTAPDLITHSVYGEASPSRLP